MNRLIQVFKTGTHTDAAGIERTFSADNLRQIADNFDPELGAVPLVKGHPATDDPALGWVSRFMFEETSGILYAVPGDIDPGFKAEVKARRFARVSIALYAPNSGSNPVPGMYYPRHIGFLGAAAPAVKGLRAVNFNDNDEDFIMFEGNDDKQMNKFAESIAAAFTASLTALGFKPRVEEPAATPESIKVEETPEFKESERLRIEAETKLTDAESATKTAEDETRRTADAAFAEALVKTGKITPTEAERLTPILFSLGSNDDELTFGEGDKAEKITPYKILETFLSGLPVRVNFNEFSGDGDDDSLTTIGFSAPEGGTVAPDTMEKHRRIMAYTQKHGVSYIDAVSIIESGVN